MKNWIAMACEIVGRGVAWWWQEIAAGLLPGFAAEGGRGRPVMVRASGEDWLLAQPGDGLAASGWRHFDRTQTAQLKAACANRPVWASLDDSLVHLLVVPLPSAVSPTTEAVGYTLMTHSPLALEEVVFDWKEIPAVEPGTRMIEVALCRATSVGSLRERLAQAGLSAQLIGFSPAESAGLRHVFSRVGGRGPKLALQWAGLVALGVFSAVAVGGVLQWQSRSIEQQLQSIKAEDRAAGRSHSEAARVRAALAALEPVSRQPSRTTTIDELARLLPPEVFLVELRIEHDHLKMLGVAKDPGAAIRSLGASRLLKDVRLGSVVAPGTPGVGSGFEITARLVGGH